ncbi:MAG: hypothetical protein L6Q37_04085, partial [Bdellovibrionaceae bacterium]|nr:hypothetical protein [Pseudobdellovibrionaceae bacterium]
MELKTSFKNYYLTPKSELNSLTVRPGNRHGLWVKITPSCLMTDIEQFLSGFFDYIHWPELGDEELKQSSVLNQGARISKFVNSLINSEDNFLKEVKTHQLLTNFSFKSVRSNYVFTPMTNSFNTEIEKVNAQGFDVLKLKITKNFEEEIKKILRHNLNWCTIRLDFNSCQNFKTLVDAKEKLKKIPYLEYLEDPCPFDIKQWFELKKLFPLALDSLNSKLENNKELLSCFDYLVCKTARPYHFSFVLEAIRNNKKIVFTNMMDSFLGTWKTYFIHSIFKNHFPNIIQTPGFYTHHLYQNS